jgi:hypothetical protein
MHQEGGCQCGNIRYEFNGTPVRQVVCHCTDCQCQSGSAFGMTLVVREDDFKIKSGEVNLYHSTSEEGRKKLGAFCPDCGTRVYHQPQWRPGMVSIKPGTLDDASWFKPQMHIWTKSKLPWVIIPEGIETHEAQP